jgi:uncharacterized membrane protein
MSEPVSAMKMKLWLRLVLFGSLALNLLVVGLFAGSLMHRGKPHKGPRMDAVTPYARALEQEQRREMSQQLRRSYLKQSKAQRGEIVAGYERALAILRADRFDASQMQQVLEQQQAASHARRAQGQGIMLQVLSDMTPAQRLAFADRLEVEVERIKSRKKRWRDGKP